MSCSTRARFTFRIPALGLATKLLFDSIPPHDKSVVIVQIGTPHLTVYVGLSEKVHPLRDTTNRPIITQAPPTMLLELVRLTGESFTALIEKQAARLLPYFGDEGVDRIEMQFQQLLRVYKSNVRFKERIDDFGE